MDFSLNDHQKLIRDTVRQFMEAEVRPFVKEMEKEAIWLKRFFPGQLDP